MSAFEFVDELPPMLGARRYGAHRDPLLVAFAEELRAHLGRWAEYPKKLTQSGRQNKQWAINKGDSRAPASLRRGGFEAASRNGVLYVRYVGEAEQ